MQFRTDCKWWQGDKPCPQNRLCDSCPAYLPLGPRILIIKLGARGDVLRTTPIVAGLRTQYPDAHITWVTAPESIGILTGIPGLDRLLAYDNKAQVELMARHFELLICLDKDSWATGLAELVPASRKMGWGMAVDGTGTPRILNPEAAYSLALGVSDDLKFKQNEKNYMQIIFEACGLHYAGELYQFSLTPHDREKCREFFQNCDISGSTPVIGFFTGCGPAFQRKRWTEEGFANLARRVRDAGAEVLLLSGPAETAINDRIRSLAGIRLLDSRGDHTLREFAAFIERCQVLVTGDTLALHIALALQRQVVCLFGPTCDQEIELFGLGEKIVTPVDCAPCYRTTCEQKPTCMDAISVETVWAALQRVWRKPV